MVPQTLLVSTRRKLLEKETPSQAGIHQAGDGWGLSAFVREVEERGEMENCVLQC